jgi:hypothetical protein
MQVDCCGSTLSPLDSARTRAHPLVPRATRCQWLSFSQTHHGRHSIHTHTHTHTHLLLLPSSGPAGVAKGNRGSGEGWWFNHVQVLRPCQPASSADAAEVCPDPPHPTASAKEAGLVPQTREPRRPHRGGAQQQSGVMGRVHRHSTYRFPVFTQTHTHTHTHTHARTLLLPSLVWAGAAVELNTLQLYKHEVLHTHPRTCGEGETRSAFSQCKIGEICHDYIQRSSCAIGWENTLCVWSVCVLQFQREDTVDGGRVLGVLATSAQC